MAMVPQTKKTNTVGYGVSSPYFKTGTVVNSNSGAVAPSTPVYNRFAGTNSNPVGVAGTSGQLSPQVYAAANAPLGGGSSGGGQQAPAPQDQGFDLMSEINNIYNPAYSYLNEAESALRNQFPSVLQEAQSNYDTNAALLGNQRTSGLGQLDLQGNQASQQNENALAAARRLYNDLRTGYQQRFGGSSSAGQAAFELAGVEQQRQQGQQGQAYQQTLAQIAQQRQSVEDNYKSGLLQLEQQKQVAVNQANRDFQQKLLDITNNRTMLDQAKAQARLSALQELRNQVYTINQQTQQFSQTLEQQRQQAAQQLQTSGNQISAATGASGQATNQFLTRAPIQSNLQTNQTQQGQQGFNPYVGAISPRRPEDQYNQFPNLFA